MQTISTLTAAGDTDPGPAARGQRGSVPRRRRARHVHRRRRRRRAGRRRQGRRRRLSDAARRGSSARPARSPIACAKRSRSPTTRSTALASSRPEWHGMACVLTVAVVEDGRATIGHVGDTRLYKLRGDGDREDHARSLAGRRARGRATRSRKLEAMRHPRRNEVYRDVGSEPARAARSRFIDLHEIPFEPDAALLLCSDGLTDLVESTTISGSCAAGGPAA